MIRAVALSLLSLACAAPAAADVLKLKDGRVIEGVVEVRKSEVLVLSRFGTTSIPRDQVVEHLKGPSVDAQVKRHLAALAADDADGRMRLAAWLDEIGRTTEAHALARRVIEIDPEHSGAQKMLGYVRYRGRWMTPDAANRARGLEKHGDKWYTPDEWKLADPARKAAAKAEEAAARERRIQRLTELLVSPDPALRARARKALRSMAKSKGISEERANDALKAAAEYVLKLDDARTKAGASGAARRGWMLAEVHDDFTKLKEPITRFATTLASSSVPVTIQLPEVQTVRVRTTVAVPVLGLTPSK